MTKSQRRCVVGPSAFLSRVLQYKCNHRERAELKFTLVAHNDTTLHGSCTDTDGFSLADLITVFLSAFLDARSA